MRKILSLIALIVFFAFYGCSSSNDEEDYDFIENATFDTSLLFGRWDVEYIETPYELSYWYDLKDIRLTFSKDGTFNAKYSNTYYDEYEITSKYSIKGEIITLDTDPIITIEPTKMDDYDVYFLAKYNTDNMTYAVYCKGKKR